MGDEHIIQDGAEKLGALDTDAEHNHEQRIEDAARVEVRDDEALLLKLLYLLLLQLLELGNGKDFVEYLFVNHFLPPPRRPD